MERREAPGAGEAPLAELARPRCAPTADSSYPGQPLRGRAPPLTEGAAPPGAPRAMRVVGAPRPIPPSNVNRDDALCEQGGLNIRAVWRAGISYFAGAWIWRSHTHLQRRDERFLRNIDLAELPRHGQLTLRQWFEGRLGDHGRRLLRRQEVQERDRRFGLLCIGRQYADEVGRRLNFSRHGA